MIYASFHKHYYQMQINYDQYIRNFRIFYQQLSKGHPNQQALSKQFKALLDIESRKWRKSYKGSEETQSDNSLLNKVRQNRKGKQKVKLNMEILYSSNKLQNCVVYGYLFLILQYKNVAAFAYLQQNLKEPMSKKDHTPQEMRKMHFVWGKFDEIVSGKRKIVRFDKQMQQYFKELPNVFLEMMYRIITQQQVLIIENKTMYFQQLSELLTLKIQFFELNELQILKKVSYGQQFKYSLKIGYLSQDKIYVNVLKLPEKQETQINKEATLEKFASISSKLNDMYVKNLKQYMNLNNLKDLGESSKFISNNLVESRANSTIKTSDFGDI